MIRRRHSSRPTCDARSRRSRTLLVEGLEGRQMLASNVAVASDAGLFSTPLVRLVDAETGAEQASVMAFESGFRGGVRLAMGRVTGNSAADIVAASGAGRVAEVRVFRPVTSGGTTTLTQVLAFQPFGRFYRGGIDVACGDLDADAVEDIVVSQSTGGGDVKVFKVTNAGGVTTVAPYATIARPFGRFHAGGSSVGVADVGEFATGAFVRNLADNKVEILVGSGIGIRPQVRVYDISSPATPRVADTIAPAFDGAFGLPFRGGVTVTSGRYATNGAADMIDDIVVSIGRGGSGSVQTIVYDGTVSAAANTVLESFATYGVGERPTAQVFTAPVDVDGNGQIDRFLVTQGAPGGPPGIANVSIDGVRSPTQITSLAGPLRIAAARTVFQTINGIVATPSPTAGIPAGSIRPMQILDIVTGTGTAATVGRTLTVHYTGMLTNGAVFDSSRQPGRTPFQFTLGSGAVIAGWEAGPIGMKVGGRRLFAIPPELAYGDAGVTVIPSNAITLWDVELLSII